MPLTKAMHFYSFIINLLLRSHKIDKYNIHEMYFYQCCHQVAETGTVVISGAYVDLINLAPQPTVVEVSGYIQNGKAFTFPGSPTQFYHWAITAAKSVITFWCVCLWPCIFVLAAIKVIQWASRMVSDGTVGIPSAPSVLNLQKVNFGVVLWWWIILCFHHSSSLREQFLGVFLCSIFLLGAWLWPCSKIYLSVGDKFMDLSMSIDPLAIRAVYSHVPILGVILGVKIVYKLKRVDTQNYANCSGAFCIV